MFIFLSIVLVIISIAIILCVLFQTETDAGLGSSIMGGAESLFGSKKKGMDELLAKGTKYLAIAAAVLAVIILIIQ